MSNQPVYWKMRNGKLVSVDDMDTNHIKNMKTYEIFIKNLFKRKPRVKYYENGQKKSEEWIEEWVLNGKYHRVDGPAYQYWYKNGQKVFK